MSPSTHVFGGFQEWPFPKLVFGLLSSGRSACRTHFSCHSVSLQRVLSPFISSIWSIMSPPAAHHSWHSACHSGSVRDAQSGSRASAGLLQWQDVDLLTRCNMTHKHWWLMSHIRPSPKTHVTGSIISTLLSRTEVLQWLWIIFC